MPRSAKIQILPLVWLIRLYQIILSPWLGSNCRFQPTCSSYFLQSLQAHGLRKGSYLGFKRLAKCHPWGGSGFDPVPVKLNKK